MCGAEAARMTNTASARIAVVRSYVRLLKKHGVRGARRPVHGRRHAGACR